MHVSQMPPDGLSPEREPAMRAAENAPETYSDPAFIAGCERVLNYFIDQPSFTVIRAGAGSTIRQDENVRLEQGEWVAVATELMKRSEVLVSTKSEAAKKGRLPNDTFFIRPEKILEGTYPYCTDDIKEKLAKKLAEAERNN